MLRIHPVCVDLVRAMRPLAEQIQQYDKDQARQLRRSATSLMLNLAEGEGGRGGTRRARYESALGSAMETLANLQVAEALGYVDPHPPRTRTASSSSPLTLSGVEGRSRRGVEGRSRRGVEGLHPRARPRVR